MEMKRVVALLLVVVMVFALCACGSSDKAAFTASKEAYSNIISAYNIVEAMGSDIYEAWRLGIYEDDEILDGGTAYLAKELALSEDELVDGIVYHYAVNIIGIDWDADSADEGVSESIETLRSTIKSSPQTFFKMYEDDLFSVCVSIVSYAYQVNGKFDEAQELLDAAKSQMKDLSENYSDYEHYPNLKGLYTTTKSLFDFCENPTGSFEQVKTTINDYRNEARDYISDLDYIFEDE